MLMSKRTQIQLSDNMFDILRIMSEGNPGALTVLLQLRRDDSIMSEGNPGALTASLQLRQDDPAGLIDILHLYDMNIRGPQIWIGYKDFCGQNINTFREAIRDRNADMVDCINKEYPEEKAVTHSSPLF